MKTQTLVRNYIGKWKSQGYSDDIPDEVPNSLMRLGLAPSYKAIAICLLKNDMNLLSLGFSAPESKWYGFFKKRELEERAGAVKEYDLFA